MDECRICKEGPEEHPLESFCECRGSLQYCHEHCLIKWLNAKRTSVCEICKGDIKGEEGVERLAISENPIFRNLMNTLSVWILVKMSCLAAPTVVVFLSQLMVTPFIVVSSFRFVLSADTINSVFSWVILCSASIELWIQRVLPVIGIKYQHDIRLSDVLLENVEPPSLPTAFVRVSALTFALLLILQRARKPQGGSQWEFITSNFLVALPLSGVRGGPEYIMMTIVVLAAVFVAVAFPAFEKLHFAKLHPIDGSSRILASVY
eukprot:TRINITY_DN15134_c2_g2_i1.p1 TRINITY_DN15134_c2_g2~~TRINITY_DN15134_c2_g2_i1.p1  ORF type:complete len:263 (+),score=33.31 TRINITY_DN15134_c2_g2_i1:50-838(+)